MNLNEFIIECIKNASTNVFTTMMGVDIRQGEERVEAEAAESNDGVVSLIGLAGTWVGTGSIVCSPALACRVCAQLLMTESASVDEDVLDAVAELTNMIIGSVKTDLEKQLGPLGLSIPTVVFGRNFKTRSSGNSEWIVVRFYWDEDCLTVKLCLTKSETVTHPHMSTHTCTLNV